VRASFHRTVRFASQTAPPAALRKTSSMLAQGTRTIDEPK